ncbi:unnamed protein product [Lactuca saligna]|uniref:Plant PDR ABC transporter associated domain-containing protein n=1 Tax=Lactuca saligna TaxID=75948 RepID=A0AA35YMD5_LACSI|nr:unnamed protein product [Lactuca saligna]
MVNIARMRKTVVIGYEQNKGLWDPFSNNELVFSENFDDNQSSGVSNCNNQDGDTVVDQSSGATDVGIDGSPSLDATISHQESISSRLGSFGAICEEIKWFKTNGVPERKSNASSHQPVAATVRLTIPAGGAKPGPLVVGGLQGNMDMGKINNNHHMTLINLFHDLPTDDNWYWLGVGVLLLYDLAFNIILTLSLAYLNLKCHLFIFPSLTFFLEVW